MSKTERPLDILGMLNTVLKEGKIREIFRSAPYAERLETLGALGGVYTSLRADNAALKRIGQRNVAVYLGIEGLKPEEALAKLFMSGKFLVPPSEEQLISNLLPQATKSLLLRYAENINENGEDALAHLCLPSPHFRALTWQVNLTIDGQRNSVTIRRISQLTTALNQFRGDSPDNSMADNFGRKINTDVLVDKLTQWDAITEEQSTQAPQ